MADLTRNDPEKEEAGGSRPAAEGRPVAGPEGWKNPTVDYERSDLHTFAVSAATIGVLIGTIFIVFAMWFLFTILKSHSDATSARRLPLAAQNPPEPAESRMEQSPEESLRRYREAEQRMLDGYSWIDRENGIVSIPVGKAMDLVARRGLPPAKLPPGVVLARPSEGMQNTGFEGKVLAPPQ